MRGDWQLLAVAGPAGPDTQAGGEPNPLPLLRAWKLLDNLRRSLVPPALLVLLVTGLDILPGSPWLWTAARPGERGGAAVPVVPGQRGRQRPRRIAVGAFSWAGGLRAVIGQVVLDIDVPGLSGRAAARRDRPHAGAAVL